MEAMEEYIEVRLENNLPIPTLDKYESDKSLT